MTLISYRMRVIFVQRKTSYFRRRYLCLRFLPSWVGQRIVLPSASVQWTLAGRKKPRSFDRGFMLALPIFPGSRPPSIVGVHVLNFCVRDGNRWTHMTINTNFVKSSNLSVGALCSRYLSSRAVTRQVLSAYMCLTSVFGMGTGGPSPQSIPTSSDGSSPSFISKAFRF